MSPDERAAYDAAQDHEAEAVMQTEREHALAEQWESRALLDEAENGHLRTLAAVLERHALPLLDPEQPLGEAPAGDVAMPSWALPEVVVRASFDTSTGIAAAREWSERELDAMRELVER